jgi:hypothetical protein
MRLRRPTAHAFTSLVSLLSLVAAGSLSAGCATEAILTTDHLPVRRVIIYRNGVAYFERAGKVDGSEVRFKMKQAEVGDFLATLAVMEKGESSVRAAAFPLDRDEPEAGDPPPDDPDHPSAVKQDPLTPQQEADAADRKKGLRTVVLSLDGKEHDLQVGYVAASPVWRPSYRLVVHPDGTAGLQAWGIVENLSGEDWKGVHLSLVAGSPLAFETDLGTPLIPQRAMVTDVGEVISSVPHGETTLNQAPAPVVAATPPPPPPPEPSPMAGLGSMGKAVGGSGSGGGKKGVHHAAGPRKTPAADRDADTPAAAPAGVASTPSFAMDESAPQAPSRRVVPSGPRDLRSLAAVVAQGGSTRYDPPNEVTIPDKSATMVMLLSRPVPGEALFLFAPDGGVSDSAAHPFRVAQFTNKTGGVLERGPIAVFDDGSFLGQGLVDPLPDGATATVPFALERSIAVDVDRKWNELGERVAKIENGQLTVERDSVRQTKYRVRNGGDKLAKVLVKHAREGGSRLVDAPKGTDDNVGTGTALIPTNVAPNTTTELVVDERTPSPRLVDWFSPLATTALKVFLAGPHVDHDLATKLVAASAIRDEIVTRRNDLTKVEAGLGGLLQSAEETRKNLRAIEKNRVADALRATLTQRLTETSTKIDVLTKQKVELDSKLAELEVRFKEALRDVKYVAPVTTQP